MPKILKETTKKEELTLTGNNRNMRKNIEKVPKPIEIPLNPLFDNISYTINGDHMQNLRPIM